MNGDEEPSWASSTPAAEAATGAPPSSSSSSASAGLGGGDATAAASSTAGKKASKISKDNIAGSILGSMNATKKTKEITAAAAAANQEEEQDLTKTILFMRVVNMAASVLLVTCSVSVCVCASGLVCNYFQSDAYLECTPGWIISTLLPYCSHASLTFACPHPLLRVIMASSSSLLLKHRSFNSLASPPSPFGSPPSTPPAVVYSSAVSRHN